MNIKTAFAGWSALFAHVPEFVLLLVVVPLVAIVAIKFWLAFAAESKKPAPKPQRLISSHLDANGIPILVDPASAPPIQPAKSSLQPPSRIKQHF